MKILVLMAGSSNSFSSDGHRFPKYLLEVKGKPLIQHVINSFASIANPEFIFILKKSDNQKHYIENIIRLLIPNATVVSIEGETQGAACSALLAIDYIYNDEPVLITNGDQVLDINYANFLDFSTNYDASTIIFDSVHPRWSYVKLDKNQEVIEASEKKPISRHATAGTYLYKKGKYFVDAATEMIKKDVNVNHVYYICPTLNELILKNKSISAYSIQKSQYHQITTPQELKAYEASMQQ